MPYTFQTSMALAGYLGKATPKPIAYGRGVGLDEGDLHFYYSFDAPTVDGQTIDFVDAPHSLDYSTLTSVNKALVTEPFDITDQSKIVFIEQSGFQDLVSAARVLGTVENISWRAELLDVSTGSVIALLKNSKLDPRGVRPYGFTSYRLNTAGCGTRKVAIKITFFSTLDAPKCALMKIYSEPENTESLVTQSLKVQEIEIIRDYVLELNYPNPFNPTTEIRFALPNAADVSLGIYDILGREVTVLASGYHESGYHSVTWNASNVASGVYFARLTVRDELGNLKCSKVNKLLLMK